MSKISAAAGDALAQLQSLGVGTQDANRILVYAFTKEGEQRSAIANFFHVVQSEPALAPLMHGWMQTQMMGCIIQPHVVPYNMLQACLRGSSIDTLEKFAVELAAKPEGSSSVYVAICGFQVHEPISLSEDISIQPPGAVPDGDEKAKFVGGVGADGFFRPPANAFVKYTYKSQRVLFKNSEEVPKRVSEEGGPWIAAQDIARAATALSARPIAVMGSWSEVDGLARLLKMGSAYQFTSAFNDTELMIAAKNPATINADDLKAFYDHWTHMSQGDREALQIALDRLAQGLKRGNLVDQALDFGIALEILLLHGVEANTELSFRFQAHGANFLGGKQAERMVHQKALKAMYGLRSQAAHNGALKSTDDGVRQTLKTAGELAAKIAHKLVLHGGFPVWNEKCVIGGD